ncbi:hypothetical protein BJY59DRAFT_705430 [Rhodotorula toruloides]
MSSDTAFDELSLMARYTSFSTYFTITLSLLTLGALVVSIFPQAETAKWLSRMIWVGWLATWGFGVFGICAYLSADSFVKAGCRMDQECWTYREKLRVRVILSVFATLAIVFYCSIILSSFVHVLHPHLFLGPDSDSEDDFSDPDEAAHLALEDELKRSGHFAARGALKDLKDELGRRRDASQSVSRRRTPAASRQASSDEEQPPAYRSRSRGSTTSAARQKQTVAPQADEYSSGSEAHSSDDEEQARKGLMRAGSSRTVKSGPALSSDSESDAGTIREKSLGRSRRSRSQARR